MFAKPLAALALLLAVCAPALAQGTSAETAEQKAVAAKAAAQKAAAEKAGAVASEAVAQTLTTRTEAEKTAVEQAVTQVVTEYLKKTDDQEVKDLKAEQDVKSWFVGAGLGTRINIDGERVTDVGLAELANGDLVVQVKQSDEAEIRILFESHFLFQNVSVNGRIGVIRNDDGSERVGKIQDFWQILSAVAQCGFFSFSSGPVDQPGVRGCGPFVAVAFNEDASPEEFAIGHMISYGGKDDGAKPFNLGYGLIFDPDSVKLDRRMFIDDTMTIRPEFRENVLSGKLGVTQREKSVGFLILFSTNF